MRMRPIVRSVPKPVNSCCHFIDNAHYSVLGREELVQVCCSRPKHKMPGMQKAENKIFLHEHQGTEDANESAMVDFV